MARAGLRVRLLAGTVLVAAGAVAATAWLAVQGTTGSIAEQQGVVDRASSQVYSSLENYAAKHADWHAVQPTLVEMATYTGTRLVLTPVGGAPIASSPGPDGPVATAPSVQIDPLAVDTAMGGARFPDGIDPAVVGPFQLTTQEHADLEARIEDDLKCLPGGTIIEVPSGRPYLRLTQGGERSSCAKVLRRRRLADRLPGHPAGDTDGHRAGGAGADHAGDEDVRCHRPRTPRSCWTPAARSARRPGWRTRRSPAAWWRRDARCCARTWHRSRTSRSPPAESSRQVGIGLDSAGLLRIAGVTAIVLVLTVGVAMLLANRVIRPVRVLTAATRRMRAGDGAARARVRARWEIAELADAFNEMAEHTARTEEQRRELVSDVSHELRTPLGTIRGWLIAAQDGVADLDDELVSSLLQETLVSAAPRRRPARSRTGRRRAAAAGTRSEVDRRTCCGTSRRRAATASTWTRPSDLLRGGRSGAAAPDRRQPARPTPSATPRRTSGSACAGTGQARTC